jgi:hypothetical protein
VNGTNDPDRDHRAARRRAQYATTAAGVIAAGVADIAVAAVVAGSDGNALINTGVTLTTRSLA